MALAYWGALALYRPWVLEQQPSRFLYAGAVFVLLIAVELVRDVRLGPGAWRRWAWSWPWPRRRTPTTCATGRT